MNYFSSIILGIVQGFTEFLPISSSGHLIIFQTIFGIEENLAFDVLLHMATLVAVFIVFWQSIRRMIIEFFAMFKDLFQTKSFCVYKSKYRKYIILIIVASIPAALVGFLLDDLITKLFSSIVVVACMLILTGILLILGERIGKQNTKQIVNMDMKNALVVGLFQAIAITPGLSRSGSTIVGGMISGLKRDDAAEFSFLVSIPVIIGAFIFKISDISIIFSSGVFQTITALLGFAAALISGIFAIKVVLKFVTKGKLHYFSYYCFGVAIIIFIYLLTTGY